MVSERIHVWAAIAQVVSAAAVVITLAYAIGQFKFSESVENSEIEMTLYERQAEWNRILAENPDLVEIVIAGRADPKSETPSARMRHAAFDTSFYDTWEFAWRAHREGFINGEIWSDWNEFFVGEARKRSPEIWQAVNIGYYPEFEAIVNRTHGLD